MKRILKVMKWIKASDRLPKEDRLYHCNCYGRRSLLTKEEIHNTSNYHLDKVEWLDEQPSPPSADWKKRCLLIEELVEKYGHLEVNGIDTNHYNGLYKEWQQFKNNPIFKEGEVLDH